MKETVQKSPDGEIKDNRKQIEDIMELYPEISPASHAGLWGHNKWTKGKLMTEEEYLDAYKKYKEIY